MSESNRLPTHIGFIMDGNRRWAKSRGLSTAQGHKAGANTLEHISEYCYQLGIRYITFYAFSTENWSRPKAEISVLMTLFSQYLDSLLDRWKNSVKEIYHHTQVRFIGDLSLFDEKFREKVNTIYRNTDTASVKLTMNIAINYGGRSDIVQAANQAISQGKTVLTEQDISENLYTAGQPDPDLIIRTGGEMRLSNFMLWQASYAEYYSDSVFWPDFDSSRLDLALNAYARRVRKFGGQ